MNSTEPTFDSPRRHERLVEPPHSDPRAVARAIQRIRGEYSEMPGLCLTLPQASRLLGLDRRACQSALSALVDAGFLSCNRDGAYLRYTG